MPCEDSQEQPSEVNGVRRCGSGVEQLTRNEQVVGSIPTSGSIKKQGFQGQQTLGIPFFYDKQE